MKKTSEKFMTVIDIGSNSIKASTAKLNHQIKIVAEEKLPLRLLQKNEKKVSRRNIDILDRSLNLFFTRTKKFNPVYRVFATSALRRAKNKNQILAMIQKKYGVKVRVISGATEAKYVLRAVESKFDLRRGKFCIADIGGGSLELIQLEHGKIKWMKSILFGSVVVKEKFCPEPARDILEIGMIVGKLEESILKKIRQKMEGILILSGGTPSTIARIFQKQRKWNEIHGRIILMKDLQTLFAPIVEKPVSYWATHYHVNAHRCDILQACLVTILALMRIMGKDYFQLSKTGLRQGILAEALAQYT